MDLLNVTLSGTNTGWNTHSYRNVTLEAFSESTVPLFTEIQSETYKWVWFYREGLDNPFKRQNH